MTWPPLIVNTLNDELFGDGSPSTMLPPADAIASPSGFFAAAETALTAIFVPSGTSSPSISRMLLIVIVVVPGLVVDPTTLAHGMVIVAECGMPTRSAAS